MARVTFTNPELESLINRARRIDFERTMETDGMESIQVPSAEEEDTGCCARLRRRRQTPEEYTQMEERDNANKTVYESLDYDTYYSKAYKEEKLDKPPTRASRLKVSVLRWSLTFLIGFVTALVALFIDYFTKLLTRVKFETVAQHIDQCGDEGCMTEALFMLVGFNVLFVTVAAVMVWVEPNAAGSGIPEIKCYLNGIKIPRVTRLRTLVCKATGVLFSVSGGLFVGKEGPMIHSGAVVGAGLPQFKSFVSRCLDFGIKTFRRDRDKRDFVSGGAAAGVAAAFGAPIGGVLFSLEEGCSFWNQKLTWRTFFCAMAATFSLNFFISGIKGFGWGTFYQPGLVNFGTFQCADGQDCHLWSAKDLGMFLAMAIVGGLLGGLFNYINLLITILRMRYLNPRPKIFKVFEVMIVGIVTTVVTFISAMTLGECRKLGDYSHNDTRTYFCPEGYYNDMATLFFNPQEVAIKQLFHQDGTFSAQSLAIFFVFFFLLACWTYGIGVPSGLFVPSLLCGAAYGRLIATILTQYVGYSAIYSGSFALVGSAAFLGGVVRMTISLTVILIESTNEIAYGLPIMIVLMISKWVGDLFNEGIYDLHIEVKGVPFLGWDHPPGIDSLTARDVMKTELIYIYPYTRAKSIFSLLKNTKHNAFPVVTVQKPKKPAGKNNADINDAFRKGTTLTRMAEHRRRLASMARRSHTFTSSSSTDQSITSREMTPRNQNHRDKYCLPEALSSTDDESFLPLRFHGMMLRSHIAVLLEKKIFTTDTPLMSEPTKLLDQDELVRDYPYFPDVNDMREEDFEEWMILDVTRYMNPSPYTVWPETPLPHVFHLFRSMGLRHLPVVSTEGEILGIITRHDLTLEVLEEVKEQVDPTPVHSSYGRTRMRTRLASMRNNGSLII